MWEAAGIDVKSASGTWYKELGAGMGAALNTAAGLDGYTMSDRATWLSFKNPARLMLLVEGDPKLYNQYSVILVNPDRHPEGQGGRCPQLHGLAYLARRTAGDRVLHRRGSGLVSPQRGRRRQLTRPQRGSFRHSYRPMRTRPVTRDSML